MSKRAEEKAMSAYPVQKEWVGNQYGEFCDTNRVSRMKYQEGYHQAEKDLALTWEDVKKLDEIGYSLLAARSSHVEFAKAPDEEFYKEVLKRFNEYKEEQK